MAHENPPFRPDVSQIDVRSEFINLMIDCWNDDPEERPQFYDIVERLEKNSGRYGPSHPTVGRTVVRINYDTQQMTRTSK